MHYIIEKNERRSRQTAIALAITLHLGLAAALYLQTSQKPEPRKSVAPIEQKQTPAKPRPTA